MSPQRPTAKELLKHKFIVKQCKKTSYLSELIDRYRRWKEEGHSDSSSDDSDRFVFTCIFCMSVIKVSLLSYYKTVLLHTRDVRK